MLWKKLLMWVSSIGILFIFAGIETDHSVTAYIITLLFAIGAAVTIQRLWRFGYETQETNPN